MDKKTGPAPPKPDVDDLIFERETAATSER